MITGIDISKWQGKLNFIDIKNNFDFVIIKATEGNGFVDPEFIRSQSEARKTGILLGYYHFARPDLGNTAIAEADWFLKTLGTLKDGEMLVLDYEPTWSGDAVTWCKGFLDRVFSKTNCRPLIYLNQSQAKSLNWKPVIDGNYGLWLAVYDYDANKPVPTTQWPNVAMKQYSNKLPYGSPSIDGDVFYGDTNTFKKYGVTISNSNPNMTLEETNILIFIRENKITEGQIRQGWGYITDNIDKKVNDLQSALTSANSTVDSLTLQLDSSKKESLDWQSKYTSANTSLDNANKSNIILKNQITDLTKQVDDLSSSPTIASSDAWVLIRAGVEKLLSVKK